MLSKCDAQVFATRGKRVPASLRYWCLSCGGGHWCVDDEVYNSSRRAPCGRLYDDLWGKLGFVTLIELALGFVAGNILFARRKPRTRLLHEHFILTPGSILETESPNSKQATKGPNANARQGATPSAVEPQVDTRRSALFASAKCEQCGHHKFFSFEELTDLRKAKPQLFDSKIDSASQSRLFAKAFRCGKCGSKDIKARIA